MAEAHHGFGLLMLYSSFVHLASIVVFVFFFFRFCFAFFHIWFSVFWRRFVCAQCCWCVFIVVGLLRSIGLSNQATS